MTEEDLIKHYGIKGMKWGIRRFQPYPKGQGRKGKFLGKTSKVKEKGNKNSRRISVKQLRKEKARIIKEEVEKSRKKAQAELNKEVEQILEFGKKHGLDLDDGGGGDPAKGEEYMRMWDSVQNRRIDISNEINKNTTDRMIKEFGSDSISRINKADARRGALIAASMLAVPVATLGLIAVDELR